METVGGLEVDTFHFTWNIENFSERGKKIGDRIYSPLFKIGSAASESQWRLFLYPFGETEEVKDCLSLFIEALSINNSWLENYSFEMSFLDDDGNKKHELASTLVQLKSVGWPNFCKRDVLMKGKDTLLINDTLKMFCCFAINPYSTEELAKERIVLNNYKTLYHNPILSDVVIKIGPKKIKAHKNILSARSKVFSAMFEHDMEENNTSTIKIDDISYEVMNELLLFLYCGKVRNINELAKSLLIAADKYDISSLKAICERTVFENLKVEDACDILILADRYNCKRLKSETIDFFIKNMKAIFSTPKFKELKMSNVELLEDILCRVAEGNKFVVNVVN